MRKRHARKSRSELTLDLRKFYLAGFSAHLLNSLETPGLGQVDFEIQFCEDVLGADPTHAEALLLLGEDYTRKGEYVKGLELDLRLLQLRPNNKLVRYNLACSYALTGQKDAALHSLTQAVELGYRDVDHVRQDRDLDTIKSDPRFELIIKKMSRPPSRVNIKG